MSQAITAPSSISLFQLETELVELMAFRENEDLTDDERAACDKQIAEYVQREIRKVDGIRAYLRHCDVMASAAKDEAERQMAHARAWDNRAKRIKEACQAAMEVAGVKKLEGATGSLLLKGNGGQQPLTITDESLIPEEMCRYEGWVASGLWKNVQKWFDVADISSMRRVVQNAVVREALGKDAVAGARLEPRGSHVEVK